MIAFFKNKLLLIKSKKNNINNSFFYALFVFLLIIIFGIFFVIFFIGLFNNSNNQILKYKKNYKYNASNISNNQDSNDLIFDTINTDIENYSVSVSKKNYDTINIISHAECEKLFLLYFNINKIILKDNTKNHPTTIKKKINKIPLLIKKVSEKKEKKISEKKNINTKNQLKKDDLIKKKIISKVENISFAVLNNKNSDKNKITKDKKEVTLNHKINLEIPIVSSSVKSKKNFNINYSFVLNTNNNFINNSHIDRYEKNQDSLLITSEISNKDESSFDNIDKSDDEEIINQNELEEYIIRLKKNIKQFPGKKVNLDIIILLDNSLVKEIIFPNKLFSLAYKMYIINILHKIDIPKKLWNKKLLISL